MEDIFSNKINKKEKTTTTVLLDKKFLARIKEHCSKQGITFSSFLESACSKLLNETESESFVSYSEKMKTMNRRLMDIFESERFMLLMVMSLFCDIKSSQNETFENDFKIDELKTLFYEKMADELDEKFLNGFKEFLDRKKEVERKYEHTNDELT